MESVLLKDCSSGVVYGIITIPENKIKEYDVNKIQDRINEVKDEIYTNVDWTIDDVLEKILDEFDGIEFHTVLDDYLEV